MERARWRKMEKGHSKMSHLPNWLAQTFSRPQCAIKVCVHSSKLILRYDMEWWAALMRSPRPVPVPVPVPVPYASPHTHRLNWLSLDWMSMTDRWGTVRWMGEAGGRGGRHTRKVLLARPNWLLGVSPRRLFNIFTAFSFRSPFALVDSLWIYCSFDWVGEWMGV